MAEQRSLLDDLGEEVTGIVAPVSLCMAVTVLLVRLLNPEGVSSSNTVLIASIAYQEQGSDSSGKKFGGALLNALIFVGVVAGMTVILFVLFKYKCYKFIFAYMGFAVFNIFFFITGAVFIQVMQVINLHIDAFSLAYGLFNFSIVGTVGLLFMPIPLLSKQVYLIWVGIIVAYIFTFIPEWTAWVILCLMAIYDIVAVLVPGGPLKALVELAVERQQELPALIYEARPAGGRPYVRGWGRRGQNGDGGDGPPVAAGGYVGSEPQMQFNAAALADEDALRAARAQGAGMYEPPTPPTPQPPQVAPPRGWGTVGRPAQPVAENSMAMAAMGAGAAGADGRTSGGERRTGGARPPAAVTLPAGGSRGAIIRPVVRTSNPGAASGPRAVGEGTEREWERIPSSPRDRANAAAADAALAGGAAAAGTAPRSRFAGALTPDAERVMESERSLVSYGSQEPLLISRNATGASPLDEELGSNYSVNSTTPLAPPGATSSGPGPSDPQARGPSALGAGAGVSYGDGAGKGGKGGKGGKDGGLAASRGTRAASGHLLQQQDDRPMVRGGVPAARIGSTMGVRAVAPAFSHEQMAEAVMRTTLDPNAPPVTLGAPVGSASGRAGEAPGGRGGAGGRQQADEDEFELPDSIKLGLGDFIFYSMLVGRAAMYDFMTVFAAYLAIIAGLGLTLLCLALFQKALPALPFSIALGVAFYFLTRLTLEPFLVPCVFNGVYF